MGTGSAVEGRRGAVNVGAVTRSPLAGLRPGSRALSAALAVVIFLASWALLDHSFYAHGRISDVGVYQAYGLQMRGGQLPYRDFGVEYPPAALPVFLLPTYAGQPTDPADYGKWFGRLMLLCGLLCLAAVMLARAPRRGVAFVAVAPLLVGALLLTRFDLWPTLLTAAAVLAFVRDRHRLGWLALGVAVAAKLFALVLLPLAAVWTLRRRGRRELALGLAVWLGAVVAIFAPFAILAPHGLWESVWGQFTRPIQVESLVASALIEFASPRVIVSHASVGITGHGTLAALSTAVGLGCLIALWIGFARGPADEGRFVRFAAACVCAFVAFSKVLSPQFLIWLVPLVALVRGRRGAAALLLLAAAALDTQYWFAAQRYGLYIDESRFAWLVLGRDLLLVVLLAVLALPAPRRRRPA